MKMLGLHNISPSSVIMTSPEFEIPNRVSDIRQITLRAASSRLWMAVTKQSIVARVKCWHLRGRILLPGQEDSRDPNFGNSGMPRSLLRQSFILCGSLGQANSGSDVLYLRIAAQPRLHAGRVASMYVATRHPDGSPDSAYDKDMRAHGRNPSDSPPLWMFPMLFWKL